MNRIVITLFLMINLVASSLSAMELKTAAMRLVTFAKTIDDSQPTPAIKQLAITLIAQLLRGERYDEVATTVKSIVSTLGKTHKELLDEIHNIVRQNELQTIIDLGYYSAEPQDESIFAHLHDSVRSVELNLFLDSDEGRALLALSNFQQASITPKLGL